MNTGTSQPCPHHSTPSKTPRLIVQNSRHANSVTVMSPGLRRHLGGLRLQGVVQHKKPSPAAKQPATAHVTEGDLASSNKLLAMALAAPAPACAHQQSQPTARTSCTPDRQCHTAPSHRPRPLPTGHTLHHAAGHKGQRAKRQCAFNGDHGEHPAHARHGQQLAGVGKVSGNETGAED